MSTHHFQHVTLKKNQLQAKDQQKNKQARPNFNYFSRRSDKHTIKGVQGTNSRLIKHICHLHDQNQLKAQEYNYTHTYILHMLYILYIVYILGATFQMVIK